MTEPARHKDTGDFAQKYYAQMLVVCPKCGAPAVIRNGRLSCNACGLMREKAAAFATMRSQGGVFWQAVPVKDWYWTVQAQATTGGKPTPSACRQCGGAIALSRAQKDFDTPPLPHRLDRTCGGCGRENTLEVGWRPVLEPGEPRDPLFGCELLLTKAMRGGVLYAYNASHTQDYLAFIRADHRERDAAAFGNTSWFTNLPAWIKSARNRDQIVKALEGFATVAANES